MKNFDKWNENKKIIETKYRIEYSEGDILMVNFGENVGVEEGGKGDEFLRPLVVIKKFNKNFALCIPLSTTKKTGIYYHQFSFKDGISNALLSQVKAVDAKRFKYRMGNINIEILNELKTKTRDLISQSLLFLPIFMGAPFGDLYMHYSNTIILLQSVYCSISNYRVILTL